MNSQHQDEIPLAPKARWEAPQFYMMPASLPAFPCHALPDVLREMVEEVSASVDIAPEVPAMLALTAAATSGAAGFEVQVGDTHREVLAVWTVSLLDSGERKTAAFALMTAPIKEWEAAALAAYAPVFRAVAERREQLAVELREVRKQLAKHPIGAKRNELQARHDAIVCDLPDTPPSPEITVQDATPEALAQKLARQFGRATLLSDEGGAFSMMLGRYADGAPNVDVYLHGHAGSSFKADRTGRPADVIPRPVLGLGMTVQPGVIDTLRGNDLLRDVGLFARFLFCRAAERAGNRPYKNRPVNAAVAAAYAAAIRGALDASLARATAGTPVVLHITGTALDVWTQVHDGFEAAMAEGERFAGFRDWASKAPGAVARIAGSFHVLEHSAHPGLTAISAEHVERAAVIVETLGVHAIAVIGSLGASEADNDAIDVLRWIQRHRYREFSEARLRQHLRRLTAERAEAALRALQQRHFVRPRPPAPSTGAGRPPSLTWEVNPAFGSEHANAARNAENSPNPPPPADGHDCEHLQNTQGTLAADVSDAEAHGPSAGARDSLKYQHSPPPARQPVPVPSRTMPTADAQNNGVVLPVATDASTSPAAPPGIELAPAIPPAPALSTPERDPLLEYPNVPDATEAELRTYARPWPRVFLAAENAVIRQEVMERRREAAAVAIGGAA